MSKGDIYDIVSGEKECGRDNESVKCNKTKKSKENVKPIQRQCNIINSIEKKKIIRNSSTSNKRKKSASKKRDVSSSKTNKSEYHLDYTIQ
jgi:hypothetical protein